MYIIKGEYCSRKYIKYRIIYFIDCFSTHYRAAMDRSVPEGGKASTSEQLQPVYEIKNMVGQQQVQMEAITKQIQVLHLPNILIIFFHTKTIRVFTNNFDHSLGVFFSCLQDLSQTKCPPPPPVTYPSSSCLTPWLFVVVVVVQMVILLGYTCYRDIQERNAKKFF